MKAKLWKDLEANIGKDIPILYEHPDKGNGKDGMYSGKEKRYGTARVKACPIGEKLLCADLDLDDNAPKTKGYSIGFKYKPLVGSGELGGKIFHVIQSGLKIDHLALTDFNREPIAEADGENTTLIPGDTTYGLDSLVETSTAVSTDTTGIHKYEIAYDSFRFSSPSGGTKHKQDDVKMADDEKLVKHLESEVDSLRADIETKKGLIADKDSKIAELEKTITDKDSKIAELNKSNETLAAGIKAYKDKDDKKELDSLLDKTKIKPDDTDLDGATPDNVTFALKIINKLNLDNDEDSNYRSDDDSKLPPASWEKRRYNIQSQNYEDGK
jgi:hypothetical protein